ncbi:acyl-CoA dehydrogenase family protein [Chloroflexota bacterium]
MQFKLTMEQEIIQRQAREFAERELEPIAAQIDRDGNIPPDMTQKLAKAGFLGMLIPRQYGGSEAGIVNFTLVMEQLSYAACAGLDAISNNIVGRAIALFGTEEHKKRYLPALAEGKAIGSYSFTEPGTGSDPKSLVTTARLEGDSWIINGIKRFHTAGHLDGPAIIFANVDESKTTAFLVDKNIEGYSSSKPFDLMMGKAVETVDTRFNDLRVPKGNLFGEIGGGFNLLFAITAEGRMVLAASSTALAQAALDESIKYAKQRTRRGVPIANMQAIQWLLAEMGCRIEPARWFTYRVAWLTEQGQDTRMESAMLKLFASHVAKEVADMGMQVHGSYGLTKDFKIERIYRQAKMFELTEGSNEVQRSIAAGSLLMR